MAAVIDWLAVARGYFRLRYLAKPLTLVLLTAAAASADLGDAKPWIVAGLVLGLIGDIALLAEGSAAFTAGLAAFLLGHLAYVVGLLAQGVDGIHLLAGLLVVVGVAGVALPPVLRGAARAEGRPFAAVVGLYAAVLGVMAICAVGTGLVLTAIGGVLFLVSDTALARERFVGPFPRGPLVVIVTYHLAQALIVLGLLASV